MHCTYGYATASSNAASNNDDPLHQPRIAVHTRTMINEARGDSKPATHVAGQTCLTDQVVSLMYHRDDATGTIIPATDDVVAKMLS